MEKNRLLTQSPSLFDAPGMEAFALEKTKPWFGVSFRTTSGNKMERVVFLQIVEGEFVNVKMCCLLRGNV